MIAVEHLTKRFGRNLVLDDISETIREGEKVVVIGPSGSGKSTFLRCLNLLEQPTKGTITFDGTVITDPKVNIDAIRRQMGMVFQHFNLFPNMTIRKNITLAPVKTKLMGQEEADALALSLLKRVNLEDKADAYPNQLSGGQKQRIAIVRALAMKPKVMLFDEPTSALADQFADRRPGRQGGLVVLRPLHRRIRRRPTTEISAPTRSPDSVMARIAPSAI